MSSQSYQKISVYFDLSDATDSELLLKLESGVNKDFINIVKDINQSDIFIRKSNSNLSDCLLPQFEEIEQFGKELHLVTVYTKTKKLALRLCFTLWVQKLIHNLNLLSYLLILKQMIHQLPSINQLETQISIKVGDQPVVSNKEISVEPFCSLDILVKNLTCLDQYYYLLLIGESGCISVLEKEANQLTFDGIFSVGHTSPYYLTHQIDMLAIISSPTKINLSSSLNEQNNFPFFFSTEILTEIKPLPNFDNLGLCAQIFHFDIQSCPEFDLFDKLISYIENCKPPFVLLNSVDSGDFEMFKEMESVQQTNEPDLDGTGSLFEFYMIDKYLSNEEQLLFKKK